MHIRASEGEGNVSAHIVTRCREGDSRDHDVRDGASFKRSPTSTKWFGVKLVSAAAPRPPIAS